MSEVSLQRPRRPRVRDAQPDPAPGAPGRSRRVLAVRDALIRSLVPVLLALVAGGLLLAALGDDPFTFYANIWQYGVQQGSWQESAILAAPLLLIAVGLIVVFRANIWNLGYDGQYLLGAALITGVAPHMDGVPVVARASSRCSRSRWPPARPGRSSPRSSRRATRPTRSSRR